MSGVLVPLGAEAETCAGGVCTLADAAADPTRISPDGAPPHPAAADSPEPARGRSRVAGATPAD
jgi:hypothetical protein